MQLPTALLKNIRPSQITVVIFLHKAKVMEKHNRSQQFYELCTSCTYFAQEPYGFTNSLILNKGAFF